MIEGNGISECNLPSLFDSAVFLVHKYNDSFIFVRFMGKWVPFV